MSLKLKTFFICTLINLTSVNPILAGGGESLFTKKVLMNSPMSKSDTRYDYPKKLLQRILTNTQNEYGAAEVVDNQNPMKRTRALKELIKGENLHVMAEAPKQEWTAKLLSVRIPIRKGIQGYRLFLIKKQTQNILNNISSFAEFRNIPTGSGDQWSTTRVLKENKFKVILGTDYEGLFSMLMLNRFSTFGRGINEVFTEFDQHSHEYPDLAIDDKFALFIPLPTYFFVSPTKIKLRDRIEKGLIELIESGEFEKIFQEEFGAIIKKANLASRKIYRIPNPNLSDQDPIDIKEYWY